MKLRFVKFLTSRENEIEKKEEGGRRTNIACLAATRPVRSQAPAPRYSFHHHSSLPPPAPTSPHPPPPSFPAATCRRAIFSSYPLPSCSASSFLFHKNYRSNRAWRTQYPASRPSCPAQRQHADAQLAAPLPLHPIRWPRLLSGSNGILSVAGGAIGKQRPKMRFSVSFPSLMNK